MIRPTIAVAKSERTTQTFRSVLEIRPKTRVRNAASSGIAMISAGEL